MGVRVTLSDPFARMVSYISCESENGILSSCILWRILRVVCGAQSYTLFSAEDCRQCRLLVLLQIRQKLRIQQTVEMSRQMGVNFLPCVRTVK